MAMGAVVATNVASAGPVSTAERVMVAWSHATPTARRVTALAVGTSPILGATLSAPWPVAIGIAIAGALLALAALVDVHEHRLPNRLLAVALASVLLPVAGLGGDWLGRSLTGATLAAALLLIARMRGGVGMGDVKAAGVVGAATGTMSVSAALIAVAVACGSAGLTGLLARRRALPLGPFLWFGWAIATAVASMGPWAR
jgi:leader peptidase (prepilin peptidase)/N-methyltransferase